MERIWEKFGRYRTTNGISRRSCGVSARIMWCENALMQRWWETYLQALIPKNQIQHYFSPASPVHSIAAQMDRAAEREIMLVHNSCRCAAADLDWKLRRAICVWRRSRVNGLKRRVQFICSRMHFCLARGEESHSNSSQARAQQTK